MVTILINGTAAKSSGALTVLSDCVNYIEHNPMEGKDFHLFTVINKFDDLKKIKVHKLHNQNWLSRILWDNGGLQKWCIKNKIEPNIVISLQNTSTKYKNKNGSMIKQIVYYHQSIPLYKKSDLDHTLKIMLYYFFYPFFVNRNNISTNYVVQLPFIKELFCKRFNNIAKERVTVIRPNKPLIDINNVKGIEFSSKEKIFRFLYPATSFKYKNHTVIISALKKLSKISHVIEKIIVYFTVDKLSENIMNDIALNNLESCVKFIGQVPYKDLLSYYKSVDGLLFPSKLESFPLPILEASCFGLPIIISDLPYAREGLFDYNNKYFINPDDVDAWTAAIQENKNYKKIVPEKVNIKENSWDNFFNLVDKLILE